jgi:hypothetical protein
LKIPNRLQHSIYVCIGRIADLVGRGVFNINPRLYARVFIPSDVVALIIQAAGGGVSVSEPVLTTGVTPGAAIVIAGLTFQVVSLTVFFFLFGAVLWPSDIFRPQTPGKQARRLRTFIICILTAILLIIGRSAFRVAELSQGVRGGLVHDELLFIIFDSFPVAIATAILAAVHPIFLLPADLRAKHKKLGSQDMELMPKDTAK